MKNLSLAILPFVCLVAFLSSTSEASSADRFQWLGKSNNRAKIEFRRVGSSPSNWQLLVNGSPSEALGLVRSNQNVTLLQSRRGLSYEILRTYTRVWSNGRQIAIYRGGWNEGATAVAPGYNYVGLGNRGGVPVNELDRAAQRHDIGYETQPMGPLDGRTDARFVYDSARAALNPGNRMGAGHRVFAGGAAVLFANKPGIYHTKPVFGKRIPIPNTGPANLPLYAGEEAWNRAVKPGVKSAYRKAIRPGAQWTYRRAIRPGAKTVRRATRTFGRSIGRGTRTAGRSIGRNAKSVKRKAKQALNKLNPF